MTSSYRRTIAAAAATILASPALYPIFSGVAWFWAGAGAAVAIGAAGILTRIRRLPLLACLAGGLAGLLLYLNLVFEPGRSLLYVIPTPSSLRVLWDLAGQGISESARYAPPVPELKGMVVLAAGGIGLTALFTDLIAVRLHSAALAGLPLLLLFTEPFTLSVSRGWLGTTAVFCLATAGYLTMLSTEGRERIRDWEQPRPGRAAVPDTSALAAAGRRVGVASVVLALFLPLFIPGLHATRLFGNGSAGVGSGYGSGSGGIGFPDPQTNVSNELHESPARTVLTYSSTMTQPGYLQVSVADNLTASGWQEFSQPQSLAPPIETMPAVPGLTDTAAANLVTTSITLASNIAQDAFQALPVPYPAVRVQAPGTLQAERNTLMVYDRGASLSGMRYSAESLNVDPPAQTLAAAPRAAAGITRHYLEVPSSYQPLRNLAESIATANGAKTPYQEAVNLQDWFTEGAFTYTLNAPAITNAAGLQNFLYGTKSGYCQQFAFAMAVMARLIGIPSRVAYGFTQGTRQKGGTWVVTTKDAHAWPELYFQGLGWLRFEPTPGGPAAQGTAVTPPYATQQQAGLRQQGQLVPTPAQSAGGSGTAGKKTRPAALRPNLLGGQDTGGAAGSAARGGLNPWELGGLSLLALIALAAIVPGCARSAIRWRRWRAGARAGDEGLAHTAWRELRDTLVDYQAGYLPSESPRALNGRVSAELELAEPAAAALSRVTIAEERARYAARPVSGAGLREDSAVVRRAIAGSASRRARLRARLFPPSVIAPVGIVLSQVTDVFGRLSLSRA